VPFDPEESGALKLYEALIGVKQVAQLLCSVGNSGSIARIVIVPFGSIFNDIPFCALHDGRSFLIEQYEVIVCPSLQWLSQTKVANSGYSRSSGKSLLLASADSDLTGHADVIYRVLNSQLQGGVIRRNGKLEDTAADAWKTLFESADEYNQIMIVAHGEQWPRPLLHFGDKGCGGKEYRANWDVGLRDVYSFVRLDCDLLIMFACFAQQQNSPFRGEWESLASAFLAKGARTILAAQYSVHTWATSILVHDVFRELIQGHSVAGSLKNAQCAFIQKKHGAKYRHPYYWAMTCVGYAEQERSRATE
jgi:CHAT domain-containing protein